LAVRKTRKTKKPEKRSAWNKGIEVGQRAAFTPQEVKRIKSMLAKQGDKSLRDLALFSTGIDTMLHSVDLLSLTVKDVRKRDGTIRDMIKVTMTGSTSSVECTLSAATQTLLETWLAQTGKKQNAPLFTGRNNTGKPVSPRQLSRLVKGWAAMIGLDAKAYGTESLRRTRAAHIMRKTGNIEAVRALLGHVKIETTARYLGDFKQADHAALSRANEL
jgi:integrase